MTLFSAKIDPPLVVAYTARYYYPPGDPRTSTDQVYLTDLHGTRRVQLTHGTVGIGDVQWIGNRFLCWTEWYKKGESKLVIYSLARRKVVSRRGKLQPYEGKPGTDLVPQRGRPFF